MKAGVNEIRLQFTKIYLLETERNHSRAGVSTPPKPVIAAPATPSSSPY
jgi:hypothetical protein